MKISAVTFVRNTAPYLIPHLRMYKGVHRNLAVIQDQGIPSYKSKVKLSHYPESPIGAEELIKKFCPEVEVIHTSIDTFDSSLFNFGIRELSNSDYVVFFHADVVFSDADWQKIVETIESGTADAYKMDMPNCWIDYYYDFDHGLRDCLDYDVVVVKPSVELHRIYGIEPHVAGLLTGVTGHHFNGWKGYVGLKDFVEGKRDNGDNQYVFWMLEKFGDKGQWFKCPQEIRDKFKDTPHICPDQS